MKQNKINSDNKLLMICMTAMFAALICVATMVIQIPSPLGGYVNFGDCFILVAAWVLGPVYGFAAGGIGSALADALTGYAHYIPGTFVIKGFIAVMAALIVHSFIKRAEKFKLAGYAVGGAVSEIWMIAGYYLYAAVFLGKGFAGAWLSVGGNAVQGVFGAIVGVALIQVIVRTKILRKFGGYAA